MAYSFTAFFGAAGNLSGSANQNTSDNFDLPQGAMIVFFITLDAATAPADIADLAGNTFTEVTALNFADAGGQRTRAYYCLNTKGKTTNRIIVRWVTGQTFRGMVGAIYTGVRILDKAVGRTETPAVATDDLDTGNVTNTADTGALQVGFGMDSTSVGDNKPSEGTGYTSRGTGISWDGANQQARLQDKRITSIGAQNFTMTPVAAEAHLVSQMIFIEGDYDATGVNRAPPLSDELLGALFRQSGFPSELKIAAWF